MKAPLADRDVMSAAHPAPEPSTKNHEPRTLPMPDLPWYSSKVPAEAVRGEATRYLRREAKAKKARGLKRAEQRDLAERIVAKRNGKSFFRRFLTALDAGRFAIGDTITGHDLLAHGICTQNNSTHAFTIIQADLVLRPDLGRGIRLKSIGRIPTPKNPQRTIEAYLITQH